VSRLIVLAKQPVPGRVKTRLCPALGPLGAARLAEAALATTLDAVRVVDADARVIALAGDPGGWLPSGFEVIRQRGDGHALRIANAFADVSAPAFLIGMDSPQVTPALLTRALRRLEAPGVDAVLGLAEDGGWWGMGLRRADPRALLGVPMSRPDTGRAQLARLTELGLRTELLPVLRDVDTIDDARAVAALIPGTPFARSLALLEAGDRVAV
jgi:glycosyltransferase A (GT-A) superfamily protein (DUF2064 family)